MGVQRRDQRLASLSKAQENSSKTLSRLLPVPSGGSEEGDTKQTPRSTWLNTSKARHYQDFGRCPVGAHRRAVSNSRLVQQGSTRVKHDFIKTSAGAQWGFRGRRHRKHNSLNMAQQESSKTLSRLWPVPSGGSQEGGIKISPGSTRLNKSKT